MVASAKTVATVLLLADPQVGWFQEPQNGDLMSQESNQNAILNQLSSTTYPCVNKNINISCSGLIGAPDATFIAGDLVNYGGHYNWWEQLFSGNCPATYFGGDQLQNVSALYHPWRPLKGITQLSGCGPIYCGLGNHDILFDGEFLGFRFFDYILSDFKDFYRYQMWNYVSQLYTGYKNYTTPDNTTASTDAPYPISSENIDSVPEGTYDWKQYSLNYVVDLGPVDIYQLHLYLGDSANGRESGLDWLKGKLAQGGYARPVVIVQHYPLSYMSDSEVERMMEILLPYNVIGLHVGHEHSRGTELLTFPWPTNSPTLDWGCHTKPDLKEIRPGSVVGNSSETPHEYFGLMRVEAFDDGRTDTNILYGQVANGSIRWRHGFNVATPPPPAVYIRDLEIVKLDERNESTTLLPTLCTELSRKSSNINDGFGGKYVYIRPLLTTDPTEAITGIQFRASNNASETCKQIGQDSSVKYRCISVTREYPAKTPISNVFLLRSDTQAKLPKGMTDMTDNLNYGRNGTYLYLTWKAVGKFE